MLWLRSMGSRGKKEGSRHRGGEFSSAAEGMVPVTRPPHGTAGEGTVSFGYQSDDGSYICMTNAAGSHEITEPGRRRLTLILSFLMR